MYEILFFFKITTGYCFYLVFFKSDEYKNIIIVLLFHFSFVPFELFFSFRNNIHTCLNVVITASGTDY